MRWCYSRPAWRDLQSRRDLRDCCAPDFLIGLANGGIDIGANAIIVELNRERLASALNYLHVLFGVGALLGPLIVSAAFATRCSTGGYSAAARLPVRRSDFVWA